MVKDESKNSEKENGSSKQASNELQTDKNSSEGLFITKLKKTGLLDHYFDSENQDNNTDTEEGCKNGNHSPNEDSSKPYNPLEDEVHKRILDAILKDKLNSEAKTNLPDSDDDSRSSSSASSSGNDEKGIFDEVFFADEILKKVNHYRSCHDVQALTFSNELTKLASDRAKLFAKGQEMEDKSYKKTFGENLSEIKRQKRVTASLVVDEWYKEAKSFKYGQEPTRRTTSSDNFTQMIWRSTREMGVSSAIVGNTVFVVAIFDPKGNWSGMFASQVPPPIHPIQDLLGIDLDSNSIQRRPHQHHHHKSKHSSSQNNDTKKKTQSTNRPLLTATAAVIRSINPDEPPPTTKEKTAVTSCDDQKFTKELVDSINIHRNKLGSVNLKINQELSKEALDWAITLANLNRIKSNQNSEHGFVISTEELRSSKTKVFPQKVADSWFNEGREVKPKLELGFESHKEGDFKKLFTKQILEIGAAIVYTSKQEAYIVAYFN